MGRCLPGGPVIIMRIPLPMGPDMASTTARKSPRHSRAVTPREIGVRLHSLSRKLDRRVAKGTVLHIEDMRYIAKKLRSYAARLTVPPEVGGSTTTVKAATVKTARLKRPAYTFECSLGLWKILPIRSSEFVLVLEDTHLDEYPSAEQAANDVRKKGTGHRDWDASKEKAPPGLHEWTKVIEVEEEEEEGLRLA
jgi:hypothetical protein